MYEGPASQGCNSLNWRTSKIAIRHGCCFPGSKISRFSPQALADVLSIGPRLLRILNPTL